MQEIIDIQLESSDKIRKQKAIIQSYINEISMKNINELQQKHLIEQMKVRLETAEKQP